jgi:hypothetical protein
MIQRMPIIIVACFLTTALYLIFSPQFSAGSVVYDFKGLSGPLERTVVPPPVPGAWHDYGQGSASRLAVLLTDPHSEWLGLAHGLKTIGIPFIITTNYKEALQHKVVYVYPSITGENMQADAVIALARFPANGGTLIAQNVLSGAMKETFGFEEAVPTSSETEVHFDPKSPMMVGLTDPAERTIRIGGRQVPIVATYFYTHPKYPAVATYGNGEAAVIRNASNTAYAFGLDLGHLLLKGYNGRQQDIAAHYINYYEPTLDVLLRCIKNIYVAAEKDGITLTAVPDGKSLTVLFTHDIDYNRSIVNGIDYATYERSRGIPATYLIQVKYIKDWNDEIFFNDAAIPYLVRLRSLGMEIGSHTVAHSVAFKSFPMGTGAERYPSYVPIVKSRETAVNGTILGELRVSRFLLEHFIPHLNVRSFRAGALSYPNDLPQALTATKYLFDSSCSADDSLTHLPFRLNYGRTSETETSIYEFPITIDDQHPPALNDPKRLEQAVALADKLKRYGGLFNILIHPDVVAEKLAFEKKFVEAMGNTVWYGSMGQFGQWWSARDKVGVDISSGASGTIATLSVPNPVSGLTLDVPASLSFVSSVPTLHVTRNKNRLIIDRLTGNAKLTFRQTGT